MCCYRSQDDDRDPTVGSGSGSKQLKFVSEPYPIVLMVVVNRQSSSDGLTLTTSIQ